LSILRQFAKNDSIIVTKPDKGRGIVIIDKDIYRQKMNELLSDASKFMVIEQPISKYVLKIQDKINNYLRKLKGSKILSDEIYNSLYVTGSGPGLLYGLPKIHKPDFNTKFQFRPIFAAYNNPSFKLSKYLVPILEHLTTNEYTVDNSHKFVTDLSEIPNANDYFMVSLDIKNLFTNVPLEETIEICLDNLFCNQELSLGMNRNQFKSMLELSVLNSYFTFDEKFYRQIQGLGMGLPLGPTFANIFMCFFERKWLNECPISFKPVFYRRYVDDTFLLFNNKSQADEFLNFFNSQHLSINFTIEYEQDN
jgi:hypothetical protein